MSFSNSLHANAAPNHFERIAKVLQAKRRAGDNSTCDLTIQLKDGYEMVHSMVVCAHSSVISDILERQRAPYSHIPMTEFEGSSVKKVLDWMYSGDIDIPESSIADVLAVASYLQVTILQRQIEQKIRNHNGSPILALNIASTRAFSVMDATMNELVLDFSEKVNGLSSEEISKLTANSIIALMASVLPMKKKIPLINMFISWIKSNQPEKETINTILQSLVISDITFDSLYLIRSSLKRNLPNKEAAAKSYLSVSPSGTFGLHIPTKTKTVEKTPSAVVIPPASPAPPKYHRTRSEISALEKLPDPFAGPGACHTVSELEMIKNIPDPFEKSQSLILCRETNGFPKYFTRSEVESLQQMTDPFSKSEKESSGFKAPGCTAHYPAWSKNIIEQNKAIERQKPKFTPSEAQMVKNMPDPFVKGGPVILSPATGGQISSARFVPSVKNGGANQSFSGHSLNNNNYLQKNQEKRATEIPPTVIISAATLSTPSARSVTNPKMTGVKKTDSEILEIQALPSFHSSSFHTAPTSQKKENEKSLKSSKSQKSQKSEKPQNKIPRSQYLYPS
ncbi:unnamed protein product [Caenorhabditis nigoni]